MTGILVNMLKKERKRALEFGGGQYQNGTASFSNPSLENQKTYVKETYKSDSRDDVALTSQKSRIKGTVLQFIRG